MYSQENASISDLRANFSIHKNKISIYGHSGTSLLFGETVFSLDQNKIIKILFFLFEQEFIFL